MEITGFTLWAPGLESLGDWEKWKEGSKNGEDSASPPALPFCSPIAVRRFSQLTKMTIYATHKTGLDADHLFFASSNGEISTQLKLNTYYVQNDELKPAAFSLSVFNTAPAQATILFKSNIPYTPLFSSKETIIRNLFLAGTAPLISGRLDSAILVYAEEHIPEEYRGLISGFELPMVIALQLSASGPEIIPERAQESPEALVKYLLEEHKDKWIS